MDLGIDGDTWLQELSPNPLTMGLPDWALLLLLCSYTTPSPPLPSPQGREKQDLIDFILLQVPPSHFFMR